MKSNHTDQRFLKATSQPQRRIAINDVTRAATTSVWYYRVDVSVHEEGLRPTFISEDESDDSCSDDEGVLPTTDVVHYSILKRYSDFLQLYEKTRAVVIITEGSASPMPPFPAKESISPTLMGLVRRSSSEIVLEERRVKFEALLQWIENHPIARDCPAFASFLGKPPQSHNGYVSLKEYTLPDWLSSLQQTTSTMESRRRRRSVIDSHLKRSSSTSLVRFQNHMTTLNRCVSAPCEVDVDKLPSAPQSWDVSCVVPLIF